VARAPSPASFEVKGQRTGVSAPNIKTALRIPTHHGGTMFEGLFQPMHLLVIFGIALLIFGPKKLPELGKGIGEGIRGFKAAIKIDENAKST
jgi:sec-independent protein translocase protein TatA